MTAITLFPQGERFKTENTTTVENTTTAETTESNKDEEDELDF